METILVEIRAAEGGRDAKLLVDQQVQIYKKYCQRRSLQLLTYAEETWVCGPET